MPGAVKTEGVEEADPIASSDSRRFALVLGAGGAVGLAYHAGTLRALEKVAGVDPRSADLVIGTSAGSVIGARLRRGITTDQLWDLAMAVDEPIGRTEVFPPAWRSVSEFARRAAGSAYVYSRLALPLPRVAAPQALRRRFPAGMFASDEWRRQLTEELGSDWPAESLYVCAVDLDRRRRVVFGAEDAPAVPLSRAVLASCAVPGVYPPIREAGMTLVDGGALSTTHLDLAAGYELVLGIVPMAFDTSTPPDVRRQLLRRIPSRWVASEAVTARAAGSQVLLVRPTADELADHGRNALRPDNVAAIATAAYDTAARLFDTPRFKKGLGLVSD
jgi:NTE family protein